MSTHFSSFTAETMRAFGERLADEGRARSELLRSNSAATSGMLSDFRKGQQEAEGDRRRRAGRESSSRQGFMSQMRSGVNAMKGRFEQARRDRAEDHRRMASELKAACDAFRSRPARRK